MSTTGYYKRFEDDRWGDDCDTLYRPVIIADTRIGYFHTECQIGNKTGYLSFTPQMKKKFKDGTEWLDYIHGPDGMGYRMALEVAPGKYFIQRAKQIADSTPDEILLKFWADCLTEYDERKKRETPV
jgi:hypothetical protein